MTERDDSAQRASESTGFEVRQSEDRTSMQTDAAEVEDGLFALWRDAAEKNVRDGIDWPSIVRRLFRTLDEAAAREAAAEARGAQAVLAAVADDETLLLQAVGLMGSHVEHFNAWFENGIKVRHEDIGGIQCTCGWTHGPTSGFRPWQQFGAHCLEHGIRAAAAAAGGPS